MFIHLLHPAHWVGGFEFLGHAHSLCHLLRYVNDLFVRLLVDVVEMFIQAIFGQQGGVRASAVLLDKLKMQFAVLAIS